MRKTLLALASIPVTGALLTLALPLGERAFLAWFARVPLLLAFRGRSFLLGFCGGLLILGFRGENAKRGVGGEAFGERNALAGPA